MFVGISIRICMYALRALDVKGISLLLYSCEAASRLLFCVDKWKTVVRWAASIYKDPNQNMQLFTFGYFDQHTCLCTFFNARYDCRAHLQAWSDRIPTSGGTSLTSARDTPTTSHSNKEIFLTGFLFDKAYVYTLLSIAAPNEILTNICLKDSAFPILRKRKSIWFFNVTHHRVSGIV